MEEYQVYYDILIKNGFSIEDEYINAGGDKTNYLKFNFKHQIYSSQRYIDSRVYFKFETGIVTTFLLNAPNHIKEQVNKDLKIALREYKIDSIVED